MRLAGTVLGVCALIGGSSAHAQAGDYAVASDAWNGLSSLRAILENSSDRVEIADRFDLGTLTPIDALLIVHPRAPLPAAPLTAFLRDGGRIALCDDFGAADSLLTPFEIGRDAPDGRRAPQLRGNPQLLVARPRGGHRLTRGVSALVTNHPAMVYHRELSPLFELGAGEAVVLAGAVGEGRLVTVGDPSVLINNMLEFGGNRRFAENLAAYLDEGRGGRLVLVPPDGRLVGRYGEPGADRPFHDLRSMLESAAHLEVPAPALRIFALALVALAALWAAGALPRSTPYRADRMFPPPPTAGGFLGRVAFFAEGQRNLLAPLLRYKRELEEALLAHLDLDGTILLPDVIAALRERGWQRADIEAMRSLLLELDRLEQRRDVPPAPPRVGARRFHALVAEGERLLRRTRAEAPGPATSVPEP
jgi:hypothetical protein